MKKQKANINQDPSKTKPAKVSKEPAPEMLPNSIPMSPADLQALFDHLTRDGVPECDHTLREAQAFLKKRKLKDEPIVAWLQQHGGYCDCEVTLNVIPDFEDYLDNVEDNGPRHFLKGRPSTKQNAVKSRTAEGIGSNQQPPRPKGKETGNQSANPTQPRRPKAGSEPQAQIPAGHDLKVMEKVARQLEWAIARDKSKLRLCREMIRKAKNVR